MKTKRRNIILTKGPFLTQQNVINRLSVNTKPITTYKKLPISPKTTLTPIKHKKKSVINSKNKLSQSIKIEQSSSKSHKTHSIILESRKLFRTDSNKSQTLNKNSFFLNQMLKSSSDKKLKPFCRIIKNSSLTSDCQALSGHLQKKSKTIIQSSKIPKNQNKSMSNLTITTSATNTNTYQKNFFDIKKSIVNKGKSVIYAVWFLSYIQSEAFWFYNKICKENDIDVIYVSLDESNSIYEKTINKYANYPYMNFVLYEQSNEIVKMFKDREEKTFCLCDNCNTILYSFSYDRKYEKKNISDIIKIANEKRKNHQKELDAYDKIKRLIKVIYRSFNINQIIINDIIGLYIPNLRIYEEFSNEIKYKNEQMLLSLYCYSNRRIKQFEIIQFAYSNEEMPFPWLYYKEKIDISFLNEKQSYFIIFDYDCEILSINGFNDIIQYQYNSFDYWRDLSNHINKEDSQCDNKFEQFELKDYKGKIIQKIPKRRLTLFNFYSSSFKRDFSILFEFKELYKKLKYKILFIHIEISDDYLQSYLFQFGAYLTNSTHKSKLISQLHSHSINTSNEIILFAQMDKNNIIKEIIFSLNIERILKEEQSLLYSLMNFSSPYNDTNIKTFNYLNNIFPLDKIQSNISNKIPLTSLSQTDFIMLFFHDNTNINTKKYTNIINDFYFNINSLKTRIEIIFVAYYESISLKSIINSYKDINFFYFNFDAISQVYNKYNKSRHIPKLMLLDKYGNVLKDNIIYEVELKGESYIDELQLQFPLINIKLSKSLIHFSFLGDQFGFEGKKITRDSLCTSDNYKYIGVVFAASWCMISESFIREIKEIDVNSRIILIVNIIDEEKGVFERYSKYLKGISMLYDNRYKLYNKYCIINKGIPILYLFTLTNGEVINTYDCDTIENLREKV